MKHKQSRNLKLGIAGIFAIGLLLFATQSNYSFDRDSGTFSLPPLGSFTNVGGHLAGIVDCKIKQTTTVVDGSGNSLRVIESDGILGSPSFNIVSSVLPDHEVSIFVIIPKITCSNGSGNDITVQSSDLKLKTAIGSELLSTSLRYQTALSFPSQSGGFQTERNLGYFSLSDKDVENIINVNREFTSNVNFDVTGNVKIIYDNAPQYVMTIPITIGQLDTNWTFISTGNEDVIVDRDNDGILDSADACPNDPENYNGYQDNDGCHDIAPDTPTSTPIPTPTPTDAEICASDGDTWLNGVCVSGTTELTQSQCDADTTKQWLAGRCVGDSTIDTDSLTANIKFQVDIKMNDNSNQSFFAQDDPSPLEVNIPLTNSLIGGVDGNVKRTAEFTVEPRIVFTNSQFHKLVSISDSNITIEPIVSVANVDYSLGAKDVRFVASNGGSVTDITLGLSLGEIVVKAFDIENAVPISVVPLGSSANADIRFLVNGEIELTGGDGTFTVRTVDVSGADFTLAGLKVVRADSSTSDPNAGVQCNSAIENTIIISGVSTCIPKGTTGDNPTPKLGDENVSICTDSSIVGGFTCDLDYRVAYCGATVDSSGEIITDSTSCGVPTVSTGNGNITPPVITPIDTTTCPDTKLVSLSLSDNACVIVTDNTNTNSGQTTSTSSPADDNMLLYGAVGLIALGAIIFVLKRRN